MSELVGLLLAAGRGRRFDAYGRNHKLLALLPDGKPVALACALTLLTALPRVVALLPKSDDENIVRLSHLLSDAGCSVVHVPESENGMGHTLAAGVAASSTAAGWVVQPADMPWVQASSCAVVVKALQAGAQIAVPTYLGQRGHPVGFYAGCRDALRALQGDRGARELLDHWTVDKIAVDDAGVLRDIDIPADLFGIVLQNKFI